MPDSGFLLSINSYFKTLLGKLEWSLVQNLSLHHMLGVRTLSGQHYLIVGPIHFPSVIKNKHPQKRMYLYLFKYSQDIGEGCLELPRYRNVIQKF